MTRSWTKIGSGRSKFAGWAIGLVALVAGVFLPGASATARDLVYGTFLTPRDGSVTQGMAPYFKALERASHGTIKWQIAAGGQIANGKGTVNAIRSDLMDAGFVVSNFAANALPASNLVLNTLIFGGDVAATSAAGVETVLLHCPQCIAEYRKLGQIPLIGYSTLPYKLMCRSEVKTVDEMKGLKVRAIGSGIDLMRLAGAVPVMMSPAAATTALQRGTIDCVDGPIYWMYSFGYDAVVKSVLDYDLGMSSPIQVFVINRNVWRTFTPAQQRLYIKYAPAALTHIVFEDEYAGQKQVLAAASKRDELATGGKDFKRLLEQFDAKMRASNLIAARKFGVKDPGRILQAYDKTLAKWQRLSKKIGDNQAKFEAALWREIYSKLDPSKL